MQFEDSEFGRVEYLRSRIAEMYRTGASYPELGSIALELLTIRNSLEKKTERMPKAKVKKFSQVLKELEQTVISLYMLNILNEKRQHTVGDYLFREYSIYQR